MSQVVIGTAGHIDHGKTALVKALTGTDTDRLAEEKNRGMTIDLGFAFLTDDITIIDVPGHEKFIRNMVSGVSTIQIALLVIAADDGIMPQTREHLEILKLLGIPQGVIAITKTDMVEAEWISLVEDDVKTMCEGTFLENAPIIHTSSTEGIGIDELKNLLIEKANEVQAKEDRGFFRLQVDRRFSKTGFGTVVTGTVVSGKLNKGDEVQILPLDMNGRVRGLQSHGNAVDSVKIGDRAAVNIAGIDRNELWRGVEIAEPGWMKSTTKIIANITLISDTKWKLKSKQRVKIHVGTQQVLAKILWLKSTLKAGETGNAIIHFEEPTVLAMDDRFVIRSYSPMETIAGGVVLDNNPIGKVKDLKNWTDSLEIDRNNRCVQFVERSIANPLTVEGWSKYFLVSVSELKSIFKDHKLKTAKGRPLIYSEKNLAKSKSIIIDILKDFHKNNPTASSMKSEELREKAKFSSDWFEFVVATLINSESIKGKNSTYWLANYSVELSDKDQKLSTAIIDVLNDYGLEPVPVKMISDELNISPKKTLELLHVLRGQGKTVVISESLWMRYEAFEQIKTKIIDHFKDKDELSVVDFKDITGLTRKTAIPLLEYLDKNKFTERNDNVRLKGNAL